jgi:hypothetical protein
MILLDLLTFQCSREGPMLQVDAVDAADQDAFLLGVDFVVVLGG